MAETDSSSSSDGEPSQSLASIAENLQRSAIQSARTVQHSSSTHFRAFQGTKQASVAVELLNFEGGDLEEDGREHNFLPEAVSQYRTYEDAFVNKVKDGLMIAKENPAVSAGVAISAALLAMRVTWKAFELLMTGKLGLDVTYIIWLGLAPRRFLFRHTLGRFQSEEARYARIEKNVKDLNLSVDLLKKENAKLLQRTTLAEKEMKYGHTELVSAGTQFQQLAKSAYKVETRAADLLDKLRYIPSREALALRAEASQLCLIVCFPKVQ
ncbi:hypothetical protein JHK84_054901 [Glycine max]|nr:hypothetical protein JHK86_054876 [Glycine max]KAG4917563.1 hypothetical protein JHK85_055844 [Glycine max]KAG5073670.1 hypothetical protein JHK84_054901 [Glycine max]